MNEPVFDDGHIHIWLMSAGDELNLSASVIVICAVCGLTRVAYPEELGEE